MPLFLRARRFRVKVAWCFLIGLLAVDGVPAAVPFKPVHPQPMAEAWRWTRLEQLEGFGYRSLAEAADGSIWFGFKDRVVCFDGLNETVYGEAEGLRGTPVNSLCVTRNGSVFALTQRHLLRFDGRRWETLTDLDGDSLSGNRLIEAPDGAVWALMSDALLCYRDGQVRRYDDVPRPLSDFAIDAGNTLWLAPQKGGIVWQCALAQGKLAERAQWIAHKILPADTSTSFHLLATRGRSICVVTESGNAGLMRFDPVERRWQTLDLEAPGGTNVNFDIAEGSDGKLWIAGRGRLQLIRGSVVSVYTQTDLPSLPFYRYSFQGTRDQVFWLCGAGSYIFRIDCSDAHLSTYTDLGFQSQGANGVRWFITRDNQIVANDPARGSWIKYTLDDGTMDRPVAVIVTRRGAVWAAGSHRDRAAVARFDGLRWQLDQHPQFARGIARQSTYEARNGDLWFGAEFQRAESPLDCSGGLLHYHFDGLKWSTSIVAPPEVPFRIVSLAEDDEGALWLGGDGLSRIKDDHAIGFGRPAAFDIGPAAIHVTSDGDQGVWIAKWGDGIYHYGKKIWQHFRQEAGLGSGLVAAVAVSREGAIWAATPGGVLRFDGTHWVKAALPPHFGLDQGPSHLRTGSDGSVWIVAMAESWYQPRRANRPDGEIRETSYLRSYRYQPESEPPETFLLPAPIEVVAKQPVTLTWKGMDRWRATPEELLEFSHRLDRGAWSPFSAERSAMLTGLAAGPHAFEVRVRDSNLNVDPTPALVRFAVLRPIWQQPWFVTLVALFALVTVVMTAVLIRMRIRHGLQLGELRLQLFANLSHELRTPLTVILGPLERMMGETVDPKTHACLETIHHNATHMLELVDQLLDFRRIQVQRHSPPGQPTEIMAFLRAQHERFRAYTEDKALAFSFRGSPSSYVATVDQDAVRKITDNLISNAIKYTPPGGEIVVEAEVQRPGDTNAAERVARLILRITDSGIGIPAAEQEAIFKLFYRTSGARHLPVRGAGIGLAFAQELAECHGGAITVTSPAYPVGSPVQGSCFTVTLPMRPTPEAALHLEGTPPLSAAPEPAAPPALASDATGKPTLLVVDDNADIRNLLRDEFEDLYIVIEAGDGARALALAEERLPDCVIADVMMPGLDGNALCAHLKGTELTSHIPVILLTARKSTESEIRGLEAGADEYVTKPVSFAVLKTRVRHLLAARARLREQFSRRVYLAPQDVAITSADELFIQRALRIGEQHLGDAEFNVNRFAREMGMSRANLFRKFKAISGQSPGDFIRNLRLERARQLLAGGACNVSQAAEAVGLLDLSYFAACFRKKFGMTPSEYAAKQR